MLINWSLIAGFDFFISYKRDEAGRYAARLEEMLKEADFRCFLDDNDASAGAGLTSRLRSALRRSKVLILIGSPTVADSTWVTKELEIFSKTHRDIIPINIAGGLRVAYEKNQSFLVLKERDVLWLDEEGSPDSVEPSPSILGGLQKRFRHRRANRNLRLLAGVAVIVLAAATITAYWQKLQAGRARDEALKARGVAEVERDNARTQEAIAKQQRDLANERLRLAQSQALASDARREMAPELKNALLKSAQAYQESPSLDAQTALLETLSRAAKVKMYFVCGPGEKATGIAFSNEAKRAMAYSCASLGWTRILIVGANQRLRQQTKVKGDGRAFAFIDRDHIGVGGSQDLRVITISSGRLDVYHGHSATITSVASGVGTQLFSADAAGEIRVWSADKKAHLTLNSELIKKVAFGPIASLAYYSPSTTLRVEGYGGVSETIPVNGTRSTRLDEASKSPAAVASGCIEEHPPSTRYRAFAVSAEGNSVAYSTEANDIVVVDRKTGQCDAILQGHTHNILSMGFNADGTEFASAGAIADADDTHGVILWDLRQVHPLAKRLISAGTIVRSDSKLALSANASSWACTYCGHVVVWDGMSIALPSSVASDSISSIAVAENGTELALGFTNGRLLLVEKRNPLKFILHQASASSIQKLWFADELYVMAADGGVSVWSQGRRITESSLKGLSENECRDIFTWGPSVPLEKSRGAQSATITWYDLKNGTDQVVELPASADACSSLAFFGGTQPIIRLSAGYAPIYLVSVDSQPKIHAWDNPVRAPSGLRTVLSLARVAKNGKRVVAASNGNSIVLFDLTSERLVANIDLQEVHEIAISSDGKRVLTASKDGILSWNFDPDDWMRTAIHIANPKSASLGLHPVLPK